MNKEFFNKKFEENLKRDFWIRIPSGSTRDIDYNQRCAVFFKKQKIAENLKTSAMKKPENPVKSRVSDTPKNFPMVYWEGEGVGAPPSSDLSSNEPGGDCSTITKSSRYDSIGITGEVASRYVMDFDFVNDMQKDSNEIVIRADCFYIGNPSNVISYNFSFYLNDYLVSIMFFVFDDMVDGLSLDYMLGRVLDYLECPRVDRRKCTVYKYIARLSGKGNPIVKFSNNKTEADKAAVYGFVKGKATSQTIDTLKASKTPDFASVITDYVYKDYPNISVTLLLCYGERFLSSVDYKSKYSFNVLAYNNFLCPVNKGLFTNKPIRKTLKSYISRGWDFLYLVNLNIRDVVNHNCTGIDNLTPEVCGYVAGCKSTDFKSTKFKSNFSEVLDEVLKFSPKLYMQYCWEYNTSVLIFMGKLWGFNKVIPTTITSSACRVAKSHISALLNVDNDKDYLAVYSGFVKRSKKNHDNNSDTYSTDKVLQSLNSDCFLLQTMGSRSFRGGYNGCFSVDAMNGYETFDIDANSAYPTAMALVPGIDYSNPIKKRYNGYKLSLDDFKLDGEINPMTPIFGYVVYEFPEDCLFPNLPRYRENDEEAPCYPRKETDAVCCCGPELFTALMNGAQITMVDGVLANVLRDESGNIVYLYRDLVHSLVSARVEAAEQFGKGSLEERLMKLIINSLYGKIAQNVRDMFTSKDKSSESVITNNASASLITSFVRSLLFSSFTAIHSHGYKVYSATTDGLITDMPFSDFNNLTLFGFRDLLLKSRRAITGQANPDIWSVKHTQKDLLNICTRGNASLTVEDKEHGVLGGVFARNGVSSVYPELPKDCLVNRKAFIFNVVSRNGKVDSSYKKYPTLKEIQNGFPYLPSNKVKSINMDFDMKRKPIKETLRAEYMEIDGIKYEVAHIDTVPFDDKVEFLRYREVADKQTCIRTVKQWERFFFDLEANDEGVYSGPRNTEDYEWRILCDCISGYRAGLWDIPYLNTSNLTVNDKVNWIQSFNNSSSHTYNRKTWDKASEKKKQKSLLPQSILSSKLEELCSGSANSVKETATPPKKNNEDDERFIMFGDIKVYFDDENEKLLEESLNSRYYENPYEESDECYCVEEDFRDVDYSDDCNSDWEVDLPY